MRIVSSTEFRSNQGKFLNAAMAGEPLILTSRYGDFNITPVNPADSLTARICRGLNEVKLIEEGKLKGYSVEEALNEL